MRGAWLALAALVVLLADASLLAGVARNRSGEPESELELTERELPLLSAGWGEEEVTAVVLRLDWDGPGWSRTSRHVLTDWFDRSKLEAAGYDCSYPVEAEDAATHYGRMLPREAWVVLEHEADAWRRWLEEEPLGLEEQVGRLGGGEEARARAAELEKEHERMGVGGSRLFPVDVGTDARLLRARYPDRTRYAIVRGVVKASFSRGFEPPRLRGEISRLPVETLHVPRAMRRLLDDVRRRDREDRVRRAREKGETSRPTGRHPEMREPRYAVRVR